MVSHLDAALSVDPVAFVRYWRRGKNTNRKCTAINTAWTLSKRLTRCHERVCYESAGEDWCTTNDGAKWKTCIQTYKLHSENGSGWQRQWYWSNNRCEARRQSGTSSVPDLHSSSTIRDSGEEVSWPEEVTIRNKIWSHHSRSKKWEERSNSFWNWRIFVRTKEGAQWPFNSTFPALDYYKYTHRGKILAMEREGNQRLTAYVLPSAGNARRWGHIWYSGRRWIIFFLKILLVYSIPLVLSSHLIYQQMQICVKNRIRCAAQLHLRSYTINIDFQEDQT